MTIVNPIKLWSKMCKMYYREGYDICSDPNITYQEAILWDNLHFINKSFFNVPREKGDSEDCKADLDEFSISDERWEKYYVAHYTQPKIINKPWDQVLQNRIVGPDTDRYDENGEYIFWWKWPEYKERFDAEEQKRQEEELKFRESLKEEEERRRIQRGNQRERRARQKAEKEGKNG